ncbi:bifunctional GNAT family N-acetyltransferase/acetate--CoA ligase family protein [Glycomyces harbinensis]|uniref:Acyl-CoA synthetase (NDP forming) n=1 Tax=Glycomyces harbinensis TaxID=58114 RepID=A0A1G6XLH2_9ACTN|nr:bifunctional GNAT family N-acetyltransferase/acetate--CoA ligase family protein [Glycomyces harbinensis]SDD78882.1 Acyl-CoA synthetase (NDP forming) [Glycomyces harbinensis]
MNLRLPPPADTLDIDGRIVRIRPVEHGDLDALITMHEGCTLADLRYRFFGTGRGILAIEARRLAALNGTGKGAALVVEDDGAMLGAASFQRYDEQPDRAEFGVLVLPDHQHRGVGTLLLEHLALIAAAAGVKELSGQVLGGNHRMLRLARRLAPGTRMPYADGVLDVVLAADIDGSFAEDVAKRERAAEHLSLRPLLDPASVAVVGASRSGKGVGAEILKSIVDGDFAGQVHPVHPEATELAGLAAAPSLAALPGPVDLVIVAVPARSVAGVLRQAGEAGVRAAVVVSDGFAEIGDTAAQEELVRIARAHDMRLVGPNCLGIVNTDRTVRLQASFACEPPTRGGLGMASQSGAVGIAALAEATRTGLGVHSFVSLGNKADVSGNDLLAYWYDDPECKAVALYLESFGNPRKFARVARAVARRKPVLAVKGGRSEGGRRAGLSHTAAAATSDTAVDSLFAQAGVIRCDTLEQMLDTARVLVDQPLPQGRRLGVVGNAGGVGVLAADAAAATGFDVPPLSSDARVRLAEAVPGAACADNPTDLGAAAGPDAFGEAITTLGSSGEVDSLVAVFAATGTSDVEGNLDAIADALDALPGLPAAAVVMGLADPPSTLGARRVPVFAFPESAVAALGRAAAYATWRTRPLGTRPDLPGIDRAGARAIVDRLLQNGEGWQTAADTAAILRCYDIQLTPAVPVASKREAVAAARTLGYPVTVKADDPRLIHKTESGGVHLGLGNPHEVRDAFEAVAKAIEGDEGATVVVQPMVEAGLELAAGIVHDPLFGSLVMLGLGGTATDLLSDKQFRLLPLTDTDTESMWRSLKTAKLLTGYRGSEPIDLNALTDMLARLGRLAEDLPEIAELDLNPVMPARYGLQAVDLKLRLARIGDEPDPVARRLR